MISPEHKRYITALEERTFSNLVLKRNDDLCYLLIEIENELHVFVDKHGNQVSYSKINQIKEWLLNKFNISNDELSVIITKNPK